MFHFIELKHFSRDWKALQLGIEDLFALQGYIAENPQRFPVVRGTGGLRKARFSPPRWKRGKRGALRICYAYLETYRIVLMVKVYTKSVKDDLSADERAAIKKLLEHIEEALSRREYD